MSPTRALRASQRLGALAAALAWLAGATPSLAEELPRAARVQARRAEQPPRPTGDRPLERFGPRGAPSAPTAAEQAPIVRTTRSETGGGLLLLSFLVPLPLPMALVAPVSTRPEPRASTAAAPARDAKEQQPGPPPRAALAPRNAAR